jgi:dihydrofolate synthase/folylpolyglutamate synthase
MWDAARSAHPGLDAELARAKTLARAETNFELARMETLLVRIGSPHHRLPPVFHVAGTNGKGSTVAFLRAMLEAAGLRVHVYTSPHLVRVNERIRIAGKLVSDEHFTDLLQRTLHANAGHEASFFELTTTAAFLAFAETPADACVLEVGMGGRLDATNVVPEPAVAGIAQLGLDHQRWLGNSIVQIAAEKAGIAKRGRPLVTSKYPRTVAGRVAEVAGLAGARLVQRGIDWDAAVYKHALHLRDARGVLHLPVPRLAGPHQADNAALAVAMLRAQDQVHVPESAIRAGLGWADWPARLQRLDATALGRLLPAGSELWLDGAHNAPAARALADAFRGHSLAARPLHMVLGMLAAKEPGSFLKAFVGRLSAVHAVPIPDHHCHAPERLVADARALGLHADVAASVEAALRRIATAPGAGGPPVVLIAGSLHLAGAVLGEAGLDPT